MRSDKLFCAAFYGELIVLLARAFVFPAHRLQIGAIMIGLAIFLFVFRDKVWEVFLNQGGARATYTILAAIFLLFGFWVFVRAYECFQNPYYRYGPHYYQGAFPLGDAGIPNWGMGLLIIAVPTRLAGIIWCLVKSDLPLEKAQKRSAAIGAIALLVLAPYFMMVLGPVFLLAMLVMGYGYGFGISM